MPWLFSVCFPVLLMLFTVGLQRLESLLHADRPSPAELIARLERTARPASHQAAQRALSELPSATPMSRFDPLLLIDEPGLPTRPNPLFQPSVLVNRV